MNRGPRIIKLAGAIALVIASSFATLAIVDYYGVAPAPDALPIKIEEATYGTNCGSRVKSGNATDQLARACDGRQQCSVLISVSELGDPAQGCPKDFVVRYQCGANGSTLRIDWQG